MRVFEKAAAIVSLLVTSQFALAIPVDYDEDIDGDIVNSRPHVVFDFDIGSNTFRGNLSTGPSVVDFDNFRFVIPEFAQLDSVILEYGDYSFDGDLIGFGGTYNLWTDFFGNPQLLESSNHGENTFYNVLATTGPLSVFTGLPLGPGAYDLTHSLARASFGDASLYTASWDYTLTFNVSGHAPPVGVPEPGTLGLMLSSTLMLAITIRSRKRKVSPTA